MKIGFFLLVLTFVSCPNSFGQLSGDFQGSFGYGSIIIRSPWRKIFLNKKRIKKFCAFKQKFILKEILPHEQIEDHHRQQYILLIVKTDIIKGNLIFLNKLIPSKVLNLKFGSFF